MYSLNSAHIVQRPAFHLVFDGSPCVLATVLQAQHLYPCMPRCFNLQYRHLRRALLRRAYERPPQMRLMLILSRQEGKQTKELVVIAQRDRRARTRMAEFLRIRIGLQLRFATDCPRLSDVWFIGFHCETREYNP